MWAVRCPPAEPPVKPIFDALRPYSLARERTRPIARCASCSGAHHLGRPARGGRAGTRYLSTNAETPIELSAQKCNASTHVFSQLQRNEAVSRLRHQSKADSCRAESELGKGLRCVHMCATSIPSLPNARSWYPPPGAMMMAAPVPLDTRNGVRFGMLTSRMWSQGASRPVPQPSPSSGVRVSGGVLGTSVSLGAAPGHSGIHLQYRHVMGWVKYHVWGAGMSNFAHAAWQPPPRVVARAATRWGLVSLTGVQAMSRSDSAQLERLACRRVLKPPMRR